MSTIEDNAANISSYILFFHTGSKYVIENEIEAILKGEVGKLGLTSRQLTMLHHLDHLVIAKTLDLNDNQIVSLRGCEVLQCLTEFNLDNNRVSSCDGLQDLECLQELSLRNNCILFMLEVPQTFFEYFFYRL